MTKQEFLTRLRKGLVGLPKGDIEERLGFYSEMIDDRMEDGLSEEDAVKSIGEVEAVAAQIIEDTPLSKIAKEKIKPNRKLTAWEIVLIVLGFPIWFSLFAAVFAVILSLYIALWSVAISLWAVFASLFICAVGMILAGCAFELWGRGITGLAMIGAGLVCAGLGILMFFVSKAATKGTILLTRKIALLIKSCFIKRSEHNE